MAEVKKARLFLRRGTDTDRKLTTLCAGELGYSTDAFRIVIGDGSTAGGRSVGTTIHVSGGELGRHFHTKLVQASAYDGGTGGYAMQGDLAVFPALQYYKADGVTTSTPHASATCVMLLTATDASATASWVSINSGIPFGNIHVQTDDIKGDYISGGDISGDVTFSGTVSTTSVTGGSAFVVGLKGTGNRNVVVTAGGQLSATTDSVAIADGTLKFLSSPVTISTHSGAGSACNWKTYTNPSGVPKNATTGLFQFLWPGHASTWGNEKHGLLEMRDGALQNNAAPTLSAAYERSEGSGGLTHGGVVQFFCPLSSNSTTGNLHFQFRIGEVGAAFDASDLVFNSGHTLTMLGYT